MRCPLCDQVKAVKEVGRGIYECLNCGAVYGDCYLGDSYGHVLPYMTAEEPPADQLRYFDFTCIGSAGVTRRHGWYDPATRLVVQAG